MNLKKRIARYERSIGKGCQVTIPVIWRGEKDERCQERIATARRKGWSIKLIRIALHLSAETKKEAKALLARHKANQKEKGPITVYSKLNRHEVLASWDPGLPSWLEKSLGGES